MGTTEKLTKKIDEIIKSNEKSHQKMAKLQKGLVRRTSWLVWATIALAVFTCLLAFGTYYIGERQIDILDQQTELMESSIIPNEPVMDVVIHFYGKEEGYLEGTFSQKEAGWEGGGKQIEVYLQNKGRLDSGPVNLRFIHEDNVEWIYFENKHWINNTRAGETKRFAALIKPKSCRYSESSCDTSEVPTGIYDIILEIECSYCGKIFKEKFKICIWGNGFPKENCKIVNKI